MLLGCREGWDQWGPYPHPRTQEPRDTTAGRAATRPEESLGMSTPTSLSFCSPLPEHLICIAGLIILHVAIFLSILWRRKVKVNSGGPVPQPLHS